MPLRYVDPHKKRGLGYWAAGSFGRSRAGQWFTRQVSVRLDPWLYRATSGRLTTSLGIVVNAHGSRRTETWRVNNCPAGERPKLPAAQ